MIVNKKKIIIGLLSVVGFIFLVFGITYSFFNFTKVGGDNEVLTGNISFNSTSDTLLDVSGDFPQYADMTSTEEIALKSTHNGTLSISGHNTLSKGVKYSIYIIHGDDISGKQRLDDSSIKLQFTPDFVSGSNAFTVLTNNYIEPTNLQFDFNGKALISTGIVKNTTQLTTVDYNFYMWMDADAMYISSTTKRATLAEGNPSLADTTSGNTTSSRYIKNDGVLVNNVTLFPASQEQSGKIIYTTNEFKNGYYNIKFVVEAEEAEESISVHLNPDGGNVSNSYIDVIPGDKYPTLPNPTKSGYSFLGWNGKNKAMFSPLILSNDRVQNEITWHAISENKVHISGTATGESFLTIAIPAGSENLRRLPAGTYTISTNLERGTANKVYLYGYYDGSSSIIFFADSVYINSPKTFTLTNDADVNIQMLIDTGYSIDQDVWVQIEEGTTATDYESYYVDNTVTVTQQNNHELTAIWQE